MTIESDALAKRLREARAISYDNPTEAARALGIEPPTYLGHENGSRGYRANATRYADFFRVNLEWLLTGRGQMRREGQPVDKATSPKVADKNSDNESVRLQTPLTTTDINVQQMPRDVPILGGGICGEDGLFEFNGQPLDYARRPARLLGIKDAYALYVVGDSMSHWREPGDLVYIHPHQPVKVGDYVVVQLKQERDGGPIPAYIKKLVRRSAKDVRLEQFNPLKDITIPTARIATIHRILDWSELLGL